MAPNHHIDRASRNKLGEIQASCELGHQLPRRNAVSDRDALLDGVLGPRHLALHLVGHHAFHKTRPSRAQRAHVEQANGLLNVRDRSDGLESDACERLCDAHDGLQLAHRDRNARPAAVTHALAGVRTERHIVAGKQVGGLL